MGSAGSGGKLIFTRRRGARGGRGGRVIALTGECSWHSFERKEKTSDNVTMAADPHSPRAPRLRVKYCFTKHRAGTYRSRASCIRATRVRAARASAVVTTVSISAHAHRRTCRTYRLSGLRAGRMSVRAPFFSMPQIGVSAMSFIISRPTGADSLERNAGANVKGSAASRFTV